MSRLSLEIPVVEEVVARGLRHLGCLFRKQGILGLSVQVRASRVSRRCQVLMRVGVPSRLVRVDLVDPGGILR